MLILFFIQAKDSTEWDMFVRAETLEQALAIWRENFNLPTDECRVWQLPPDGEVTKPCALDWTAMEREVPEAASGMNAYKTAARLHGWKPSSDGSCIFHEVHGTFFDAIGTVSPQADDAWKMLCEARAIPVTADV